MLYQTGVEYGDYTMNHVQGCAHGCKYPCYAFLMKKRFGQIKDYESWLEPVLVSNTLELLDKEIPRLRDKIQSVQLCFTTDPFMEGYPEVSQMSIAAIRKLNEAGIKCTTLTKGLLPIELAELSPENEYGITLITLDEAYREQMEPGATSCADRLAALRALHEVGCKTWVSIEPYPTPNMIEQNLREILEAVAFTDRIIFGRTNYSKTANAYEGQRHFYNECAAEVTAFCQERGIDYHIKEKTITEAVERLMEVRIRLGMMKDYPSPYEDITYDKVECPEHVKLSVEAARRSLVLLKNENAFLPLDKNKIQTVAVSSRMQEVQNLPEVTWLRWWSAERRRASSATCISAPETTTIPQRNFIPTVVF